MVCVEAEYTASSPKLNQPAFRLKFVDDQGQNEGVCWVSLKNKNWKRSGWNRYLDQSHPEWALGVWTGIKRKDTDTHKQEICYNADSKVEQIETFNKLDIMKWRAEMRETHPINITETKNNFWQVFEIAQ